MDYKIQKAGMRREHFISTKTAERMIRVWLNLRWHGVCLSLTMFVGKIKNEKITLLIMFFTDILVLGGWWPREQCTDLGIRLPRASTNLVPLLFSNLSSCWLESKFNLKIFDISSVILRNRRFQVSLRNF